jgi:glycosyltransferase involved in cell wall biosynthesis
MADIQISVVIPLYNEQESIPELAAWIERIMKEHGYTWEVWFVDDGSQDGSWNCIEELSRKNPSFKGIKFRRNYGKSAALDTGFRYAEGKVVITMDADLQDSPDEIPGLYDLIANQGFDLVSGWKRKRYDPITKTIPTKLFNWATRKMSGIKLHDFNCGLKAYRREVVKAIEVQGEMHRYIPVIAKWSGFRKITEKPVQHQARKYGTSKFGMNRFVNGFLDLFTITFISRFGKKPMHFFGLWGTLSFFAGFVIAVYLTIAKFAWNEYKMTDRPLFYMGLLAMVIGVQLFLTGFIAELIIRTRSSRGTYGIDSVLGENNVE